MKRQKLQESETIELEKEPGVEFREVAKIFITSFSRPSFKKITVDEAISTKEKGSIPKETPKKLSSLSLKNSLPSAFGGWQLSAG